MKKYYIIEHYLMIGTLNHETVMGWLPISCKKALYTRKDEALCVFKKTKTQKISAPSASCEKRRK